MSFDGSGGAIFTNPIADTGYSASIDTSNRKLVIGSTVSVDWANRILEDNSGVGVLNWNTLVLFDASGNDSVDWGAHQLIDAAGQTSIDWASRVGVANDGSTNILDWTSTSGLKINKIINNYNGISTAGNGVAVIVGSGNTVGATTGVASVATFTPGATGSFNITGYLNITAVTLDVVKLTITYKDIHGTTQTLTPLSGLAAIGTNSFNTGQIRAASGTAILVATTLTTSTGSIAYDVGATILQY